MTRFAAVFVLVSVMFFFQRAIAAAKGVNLLQGSDNMPRRQTVQTEQLATDSSNEIHKHSSSGNNVQSDPSIRSLDTDLKNEKSFNRKKFYKLNLIISRLVKDISALKNTKIQEMAEWQKLLQRLEEMDKDQDETRVQIAALGQKVNAIVKENEQFLNSHNQSTVANSQKIERLVQSVEELKQEILTTVDGVVAKAEERQTNKYKILIQEAVDNIEKCQSGDGVGAHSFNPGPSYPYTVTVFFQPHFKKTPSLVYGLKILDSDSRSNVRMSAHIIELTNTHFKMTINRWADTVMYGAVFNWMACPK